MIDTVGYDTQFNTIVRRSRLRDSFQVHDFWNINKIQKGMSIQSVLSVKLQKSSFYLDSCFNVTWSERELNLINLRIFKLSQKKSENHSSVDHIKIEQFYAKKMPPHILMHDFIIIFNKSLDNILVFRSKLKIGSNSLGYPVLNYFQYVNFLYCHSFLWIG